MTEDSPRPVPRLQHTLIKWTGTKRRQAQPIIAQFPCKIATYYEPFLGGGSVLYGLLGTKTSSPLGNNVAAGRRRQRSSRQRIERQETAVAFYECQKHDKTTTPPHFGR